MCDSIANRKNLNKVSNCFYRVENSQSIKNEFIVEFTINRTRLRGRGNLAPTGLVVLASALKCLLNSKLYYNNQRYQY